MSSKRISRFLVLSFWIISLLLVMVFQARAATTITIEPELEVDSELFYFEDIAHIETDNIAYAATLGSIKLGKAPRLGQTRRFRRSFFLTRLKQLRIDPASLTLNIPEEVFIKRSSTTLDVNKLAEAAKRAILNAMKYQGQEIHIDLISVGSELNLPEGRVTFKADVDSDKDLTGRQAVPVQVLVDGLPLRKINVNLLVEIYAYRWVAARRLARHHLISRDDLVKKRVLLNDYKGERVITDVSEIVGQRTRVAIRALKLISAHKIETPPLVERGDLVTLKAYHQNISLLTPGKALESGSLGEVIRVKSQSTKKMLLARIVSKEMVELEVK